RRLRQLVKLAVPPPVAIQPAEQLLPEFLAALNTADRIQEILVVTLVQERFDCRRSMRRLRYLPQLGARLEARVWYTLQAFVRQSLRLVAEPRLAEVRECAAVVTDERVGAHNVVHMARVLGNQLV